MNSLEPDTEIYIPSLYLNISGALQQNTTRVATRSFFFAMEVHIASPISVVPLEGFVQLSFPAFFTSLNLFTFKNLLNSIAAKRQKNQHPL